MLIVFLALYVVPATAGPQDEKGHPRSNEPVAVSGGFGLSRVEAVDVCGPKGERAYLARLRCPDGKPAKFERVGSMGFRNDVVTKEDDEAAGKQIMSMEPLKPGVKDFHMIDAYTVKCSNKKIEIYLDMYHCNGKGSDAAPVGFTIDKQGKKPS